MSATAAVKAISRHVEQHRGELLASLGSKPITCRRCGSREFVDVQIHGGISMRRDCCYCGLTLGFPLWYGRARRVLPPRLRTERNPTGGIAERHIVRPSARGAGGRENPVKSGGKRDG